MGEMSVMDPVQGDLKVMWDPANGDETTAARDQFNKLRAKGFMAYTVGAEGNKGNQITAFDPQAGRIILAPALRGG